MVRNIVPVISLWKQIDWKENKKEKKENKNKNKNETNKQTNNWKAFSGDNACTEQETKLIYSTHARNCLKLGTAAPSISCMYLFEPIWLIPNCAIKRPFLIFLPTFRVKLERNN